MGIGEKFNDSFRLTVQNAAQLLQCVQRDGLIVLQIMDRSGVHAMLIDQCVSCNAFAFHGSPERRITDHGYPLAFQKI